MNEPSPIETHPAEQWRGSEPTRIERVLAEETPVAVAYDGLVHAVLMATPADAPDLAVGFTISEGVAGIAQIGAVTVSLVEGGLRVDVSLASEAQGAPAAARQRSLESRSSCGLCGVDDIADAVRPLPRLGGGPVVSHSAIQRALGDLEGRQTLGQETRATHAAAWAAVDGMLRLVREDVGRHNALDKLIGAAARAGLDPAQAFIVITSRCSYEMVEKAALAGVTLLVAISAPTALAIRKAQDANMTLVALARADGHTVFTGAERLTLSQAEAAE